MLFYFRMEGNLRGVKGTIVFLLFSFPLPFGSLPFHFLFTSFSLPFF